MESAKIFSLVFFIFIALSATLILPYAFAKLKLKEVRFETTTTEVKVIRKNYETDYTSIESAFIGPIVLPVEKYHFEAFNVFLDYEGNVFCINDKDLFATVNFGDYVKVNVIKGYNKKQQIISTRVELFTE